MFLKIILQFCNVGRLRQQLFQLVRNPNESDIGNEQEKEWNKSFEDDPQNIPVHCDVGFVIIQLCVFPADSPGKSVCASTIC